MSAAEEMPDDEFFGGGIDEPPPPVPIQRPARAPKPAVAAAPPPNPWLGRLVSVPAGWLTEEPKPRSYLMTDTRTGKGAIPECGAAILGAAGGVGKSWLTIDATLSIATGERFAGVFKPSKLGRVLIVSAEDPAEDIRHRLYHAARARGIGSIPEGAVDVIDVHDRHMPFLAPDAVPTLAAESLVDLVKSRGPYALVIVDPLARISGASIDADNVAACALMTVLERVATASGGLVLGVHHTSQGARRGGILDATALRGATGLGDSARLVMLLTAEDVNVSDTPQWADLSEVITLTRAKANHVARWEPVQLRRGEHGELLPLDGGAREIIYQARRASDPSERRRLARDAERDAKAKALHAIVLAAVEASPGLSGAQLEIAMRSKGAHGQSATLRAAIEAAIDSGDIVTGPPTRGGGKSHHLAEPRPARPVFITTSSPLIPPADADEVPRSSSASSRFVQSDEVDEVDEVEP